MGNVCCSEGGQISDKEILNYSSKPRNHGQFDKNGQNPNLLLAYMSGDQQKFVEADYRGLDTQQRIKNGDLLVKEKMKAF